MRGTSGLFRFETKAFIFELSATGRVVSLKRNPSGTQLLAASDQPVFTVRAGARTVPLTRLSYANSRSALIARSADGKIRTTFTALERPGHLAFRLKGMEGAVGALDLTMRLDLAVSGMIGELIACVHGGPDAAGLRGNLAWISWASIQKIWSR